MMTDTPFFTALTPALIQDALQASGYRVASVRAPDGTPVLRSATGGLGFDVVLANPLPGQGQGEGMGETFADATFQAVFRVEGDLPLGLVNEWNVTRRFSRLFLSQNALLLCMDVVALGGLNADGLRARVEIWDRLVNQLIAYLREELPKLAKAAPSAEPLESGAPVSANASAPDTPDAAA